MSVDDDLSDLIGLVYEAVLEPDLWSLVLRKAAERLGADSGLLGIGSARRPSEGIAVPLSFEIDPVQQARWVEGYLARDEWWLAFSERFDEGVLTGADCVEPRQLHRTPIYNKVLARAGIEDGIFAGSIARRGRIRSPRSTGGRPARRSVTPRSSCCPFFCRICGVPCRSATASRSSAPSVTRAEPSRTPSRSA